MALTETDFADVTVTNHGSLFMVAPITPEAQNWVDEHIPDDAQWFGGAFAVEGRYVESIIDGMLDAGLEVV